MKRTKLNSDEIYPLYGMSAYTLDADRYRIKQVLIIETNRKIVLDH